MSQTWNMVEMDMKTDEYFSLKTKLLPTKMIPKDENLELSYNHECNVRSVCVHVVVRMCVLFMCQPVYGLQVRKF